MKAWLSVEPGGPDSLNPAEIATPFASARQVLIAVRACGLNFPDVLLMRDLYQIKLPRPFVPGAEVAGIVHAVGDEVEGLAVGDAVIAVSGQGGLAEFVAVDANRCFRAPSGLPFKDVAGFLFAHATSHYALRIRADLKRGERVLVLGAGGGVGLAAVEVAAALGAEVFAAASSGDKVALALTRGARAGLVYPRDVASGDESRKLAGAIKSLAGEGGFDVVLDPVGGPYSEPSLRAMKWEGRYLVVGFTAGIARAPLNLPLLKGCQIVGVDWRQFRLRDPEGFAAATTELLEMVERGMIRPQAAEVFAFDQAPDALGRLEGRSAKGKVIVEVG